MAGLLDPPIFRDQAAPSGVLSRMLVQPPPADGVTDVSLFDLNKSGPLQSPTVMANPSPSDGIQATDATPIQLDPVTVTGSAGRMTVLSGDQPTGLTPRADPLVPRAAAAGLGTTLGAAFDYGNDAVNAYRGLTSQYFMPDPHFDPMSVIKDTPYEQDYLDRFVGVQSEPEARAVMARIDQEEHDKAVMGSSGWGFISGVAAGTVSPTMLLPVGWLRFGKVGVEATQAARLGIKAAEGAAIGATVVGAQEGILHQFSETRTAEETWWNVVGAAAIGGVLGTAGAALSRETIDRLAANVKQGIPSSLADEVKLWNEGTPAGVGAAASDTARGTGELKGAFGAENLALDPLRRLQTSPFQSARNTIRDLAETPLTLAENADGIATTIGGSVETGVKMAQGPLAEGLGAVDDQFQRYFFGQPTRFAGVRAGIARATGQTDKMSLSQFREATFDALIAGDTHPVPEVQAAAAALRKTVFDPLKNEAIGVRLFDENVKPLGDEGYAPRHYLPEAIAARRGDFVDILARHFEAKQADVERAVSAIAARGEKPPDGMFKATDMTKGEIRAAAEETTDTILGNSTNRMILPKDLVAGPRGPLKERMLGIPTQLIRDFVEKDVNVLARLYSRTMATDIGLIKKFGSTDLAEQLQKINDEANGLIAKATTEKQRVQIDDARKAALRDMAGVRDRLRGTYGLPATPGGLASRAIKVVKDLNYLRLLGGMSISSITDVGHIVAIHGLTRTLKTAFVPFVKGLKSIKLAAKEVRLAGAALDMILDSRSMAISDVMDNYGRGSRLERGAHWAAQKFGVVTLMAPMNVITKQLAGITAQTRMLEGIEALAAGKASPKQVEYLAAGGIDADVAGKIAAQVEKHGAADGAIRWANTNDWTDKSAVQSFRAALVRDVDRSVVTPGQDKPLWMSKGMGQIIGQFHSFTMSATQRNLIAGLQQRDAAAFNGMMSMLALGALQYWLKAQISGAPVSDNPAKWATEAFDQSGLSGWLMDANNITEKLTSGHVGMAAFTGAPAQRYASRNWMGALLGPSFDAAMDMGKLSNDMASGKWTAADSRALRRLTPLQNLFYLRKLFDQVEAGANSAAGIPNRAN